MFQQYIEALDQHLSRHGVITDVVLRTGRSLLEEEDTREVTIFFAAGEAESNQPVAAVHLFLLGEGTTCELEVEIELVQALTDRQEASRLWAEAQTIVSEISLTEKRRYLPPDRLAESSVMFNYHFLLDWPQTEAEESAFHQTLERFAADLGRLIRLFGRP
jgi:hypothetical protein